MTPAARDVWIDRTPVDDVEAAVRALVSTLDDYGELDRVLTHTLAVRSGDPAAVFERVHDLRAAWRAQRGLPPLSWDELGWPAFE